MIALPWLRLARVAAPAVVIALLLGWALLTRSMLASTRVQRDQAIAEVREFRRLVTDATVPPDAKGDRPILSTADARAALVAGFRDRDDARAALTRIDRDTKAAKARSTANDAALASAQAANARAFERAAPVIARLDSAQPSGSAEADAEAIEADSKAAWEAWR